MNDEKGESLTGPIHATLKNSWAINNAVDMCFIFNAVSPSRQFKQGVEFNERGKFPEYDDRAQGDVTEMDMVGPPGLMPFMPRDNTYVPHPLAKWLPQPPLLNDQLRWTFDFGCVLSAADFMRWNKDELREVTVKTLIRRKGIKDPVSHEKAYQIPAAYHRIVSQLGWEIDFGKTHDTHEGRRRLTYARGVLDAFGIELEQRKDTTELAMIGFRSAVLTPILQRQLAGVPDAYTPFVRSAIKGKQYADVTIKAATEFYLTRDPTDPSNIPIYHRNLLYIPQARWHLGRLMENTTVELSAKEVRQYYELILDNHDIIMLALREGYKGQDKHGYPLLTQAEATAVVEEGLKVFFADELAELVRHIHSNCPSVTEHI